MLVPEGQTRHLVAKMLFILTGSFPMRQPVAFFHPILRTQTTARGVGWAGRSPTDSPSGRPCGETPVPPPGFLSFGAHTA
jgi:hypothetical protein